MNKTGNYIAADFGPDSVKKLALRLCAAK